MKVLAWLVAIALLVGVLTIGGQSVQANKGEAEIKLKIARLKAKGWPTCGDDMPKGPAPEDNAYIVIAPHIVKNRQTVEPREPMTKNLDSDALLEPADEAILRKGLDLDRPVLDIVAKAFRERKEFWVPRKWDQGFAMLLPDLAAFRGLNSELLGEMTLMVRGGKMEEAREVLGWCHRMQKATVQEPVFISLILGRGMMIQEQRCLLRLLDQGQPVMPLLKEAFNEWSSWKHDWKPLLATELMMGLTTARYLDSNQFWRDQTWPWILANKDANIERYDLKFPVGDSIPRAGGARRKLLQALDRYLEFDQLTASGVTAKHVSDSIAGQEQLWKDVPMFANMVVTSSSGSEPTMAAQLELVRLQPEILGCFVDALDSNSTKGVNTAFERIRSEKALKFELESTGGKIVLTAFEGGNKVMSFKYPVDLDEKYVKFEAKRRREIKWIEELQKPAKINRAVSGNPSAGASAPSATSAAP
jgi:hypothetical protein